MKRLILAICLFGVTSLSYADAAFEAAHPRNENGEFIEVNKQDAYLKVGPLELTVPFKAGKAVYLFDFVGSKNMVGAETPFVTLWDRVEGTFGVVTSLQGQGTPFIGGNMMLKGVMGNVIALPEDFSFGGFGGYNVNTNKPMYGLKASMKVWAI